MLQAKNIFFSFQGGEHPESEYESADEHINSPKSNKVNNKYGAFLMACEYLLFKK